MTPEEENQLRLIGLLIGALRECGELSDDALQSGEPEPIAAGLERLKNRALEGDYGMLRDAIIDAFDPPDDDIAEEAILCDAVSAAASELRVLRSYARGADTPATKDAANE